MVNPQLSLRLYSFAYSDLVSYIYSDPQVMDKDGDQCTPSKCHKVPSFPYLVGWPEEQNLVNPGLMLEQMVLPRVAPTY